MQRLLLAAALAASTIATSANATTIVSTLPEYNGNGNIANTAIGAFNYVIPLGETIISATFASSFGNSTVSSSAEGQVTLDGVVAGTCTSSGLCSGSTVPFTYNFLPGQFSLLADGSASLFYNQTGCCVIRLGKSTLTIETGAVPEPATWLMMILGFGAIGAAMRRVRSGKAALKLA